MQLTPKGTRTLTLARNGGTASLAPIMGRGPAGADGSNVLPTDTAIANAVNNTASATRAAMAATFARKTVLPAARVSCRGHSYMNGVGSGVTKGTNDMATLIGSGLAMPRVNRAIAGSVLYSHIGTGDDWGQELQDETRSSTKFAPTGGLYALMWGINDAHALGNTTTALAPYKQALRTVITRYRAGTVLESSDPTVTLGGSGTWAQTLTTVSNSGVGFHFNPTSGATITINTPATFPGGTIALGFVNWDDSSAFTVTGPSALSSPVLTPTPTDGTYRSPAVLRVPNVPAGAGSYVFTTSAVTGGVGCAFDYWSWEPDEDSCPLIAIIGQPKPLDYTQYGDSNLTDAGVDALNSVTQAVVAEFGNRVIYVDTTDMDHSTTYFRAGDVHPTADGHAHIADKVTTAIKAAQVTFLRADLNPGLPPTSSVPTAWTTYTPTIDGSGTTQGNATVLGAYVQDSANKLVNAYAQVTLGSTSAIGTYAEISLPVASATANSIVAVKIMVNRGAGATLYKLEGRVQTSNSKIRLCVIGTNGALSNANSTTPLTWASGDVITLGITYRGA